MPVDSLHGGMTLFTRSLRFTIFRRTQNTSPFRPPARSDWFVFRWQRHLNLFPTSAGVVRRGSRGEAGQGLRKSDLI